MTSHSWDPSESGDGPEDEVFAGVRAPVRHAKAVLRVPLPTTKTPLPNEASFVDLGGAREFLAQTLPWRESGRDFVLRVKAYRSDTPAVDIERDTAASFGTFCEHFDPHDVVYALSRASQVGLLISGVSRGYADENAWPARVRPEDLQTVYRLNGNPIVLSLLDTLPVLLDAKNFSEVSVRDLLAEEPFFRGDLPYRTDLTAREFFGYFSEPRSATEAMLNRDFYPRGREAYAPAVNLFVNGQIAYACSIGLLCLIEHPTEGPRYQLSEQAAGVLTQGRQLDPDTV
ncbi:MAG: hypothetical protein KDD53_04435 [Bdellovibrionales bacterium]|nr:hypothetical protein [Bdellovibrionales bacterium]